MFYKFMPSNKLFLLTSFGDVFSMCDSRVDSNCVAYVSMFTSCVLPGGLDVLYWEIGMC